MEEDCIATSGSWVGVSSGGETVSTNETSVDVVQQVSPDFTNI